MTRKTHHVKSLKDLSLVTRTISVQGERAVILLPVFLCEGYTSTDGNLGTDDTVSSVKRWGEDVHRATFPVGHADLTSKQFTQYTRDSTSSQNSERVATVSGDNTVIGSYTVLDTNRDGFLEYSEEGQIRAERWRWSKTSERYLNLPAQ